MINRLKFHLIFCQIPLRSFRDGDLKLKIKGRNKFGEIIFENKTLNFLIKKQIQTIFIQTDKAVYKPGQIG